MLITLIGYRGSGKTTIAGPLAKRLGWDWVDADAEIECRAGRTIREIFAEEGEPAFREIERQVMRDLLRRDRLVVAAGGGAVLDGETRREMVHAGPVVWLRASIESLSRRTGRDETSARHRPDLTAAGGVAEIEDLLARRTPLYRECATVTVDTDDRSIQEIIDEIVQRVGSLLSGESRP